MKNIDQEVFALISKLSNVGLDKIKPETRLIEDLGMDSLQYLELDYEFQQLGGSEISDEEMAKIKTVQQVLDLARAELQ